MFICTKDSKLNMNTKGFFIVSCISNIICHVLSALITHKLLILASIFSLVSVVFLVESIIKKEYSDKDYVNRYVIKIILGMIMISFSVFNIQKDYVLYVPILMTIMYLTVNNILRSKLVSTSIYLFMLSPFIKISSYENTRKFEYFAVLFAFSAISYLSVLLFHANKTRIEEIENANELMQKTLEETIAKADSIKSIHRMMHYLTCHDIRNELTNMTCLQQSKYRKDIDLFQEVMYKYINSINTLVDTNIFDNHEEIKICELVGNMNHVTNRGIVDFYYNRVEPTKIISNKNFVYSTIKNFIENSVEAATKLPGKRSVRISQYKNVVSIEDTCGGFDPKTAKSTKFDTKNHGIFLKTITDPSIKYLFNFEVSINRTEYGTRVDIIFG